MKEEYNYEEEAKKRQEKADREFRNELLGNLIYILVIVITVVPLCWLVLNHPWISLLLLVGVIIYLLYRQSK